MQRAAAGFGLQDIHQAYAWQDRCQFKNRIAGNSKEVRGGQGEGLFENLLSA